MKAVAKAQKTMSAREASTWMLRQVQRRNHSPANIKTAVSTMTSMTFISMGFSLLSFLIFLDWEIYEFETRVGCRMLTLSVPSVV